jgi:hypothetical protein
LRAVAEFLYNSSAEVLGIAPSRLPGPKGNREFFIHAVLGRRREGMEDLEGMIARAVERKER